MEHFSPGLLKVIEERLGRFGRPTTTLVVIAVALGLISWGVKSFIDNAVLPLSQLIKTIMDTQVITPEVVLRPLASFGVYIILVIISIFFIKRYVNKKVFGPTENLLKDVKDTHAKATEVAREATDILKESEKIMDEVKQEISRIEPNPDEEEKS